MSAPSHTPYLLPTDLRTAEDVLVWLCAYRNSRLCVERRHAENVIDDATQWLEGRLDRERRQACRRGALDSWRRVRSLVRWCRDCHNAQWAWDDCGASVAWSLHRCLAFRSAARAK